MAGVSDWVEIESVSSPEGLDDGTLDGLSDSELASIGRMAEVEVRGDLVAKPDNCNPSLEVFPML